MVGNPDVEYRAQSLLSHSRSTSRPALISDIPSAEMQHAAIRILLCPQQVTHRYLSFSYSAQGAFRGDADEFDLRTSTPADFLLNYSRSNFKSQVRNPSNKLG